MKAIKIYFYKSMMRTNFISAVEKYEQGQRGTEIVGYVEDCLSYATKVLRLKPNDEEATKKYEWALEVLSKNYPKE